MRQQTLSPIDGSVVDERGLASESEIVLTLKSAREAQWHWRTVPLERRIEICRAAMKSMVESRQALGLEITRQMGRPIRYTPNEIVGMSDRANYMCDIALGCLEDVRLPEKAGFHRMIRREPLGIVLAIVPWNYPYLTAINVVVPALLAGNAVVLKPSPQAPLCGERLIESFLTAGLPEGLFQCLHLTDHDADGIVGGTEVDFVAFTGSVAVGHKVQRAASNRFIGVGLELGGKDPAYVRADADLEFSAENIVDGAFFNSGQSCCAVERVYVAAERFDEFVERAVAVTKSYILDDPTSSETTLGPLVRTSSAEFVRGQILEAQSRGAKALIDERAFSHSRPGTAYLAPQILIDVNHEMSLMRDESFGPVVGIMKVESDGEAVDLMNDSRYGLTASIWTRDLDATESLGDRLETGTVFMNRCDYLDPALAWTGVKDSGRGCTLSRFGFEHLTRPKSFHLRH